MKKRRSEEKINKEEKSIIGEEKIRKRKFSF